MSLFPIFRCQIIIEKENKEYVIAHNIGGILLCENLSDFLQRNDASVVDVFAPKNERLLDYM